MAEEELDYTPISKGVPHLKYTTPGGSKGTVPMVEYVRDDKGGIKGTRPWSPERAQREWDFHREMGSTVTFHHTGDKKKPVADKSSTSAPTAKKQVARKTPAAKPVEVPKPKLKNDGKPQVARKTPAAKKAK